ncbi:MAG: hypothetical protein FJW35_09875, partial [Acidobacteria bacterium]|nr:hypothetical protein [Acidobacteriota bacterium]
DSTWNNLIYFNGQLVALHPQDDYFRLLFKDHLGSTRSVVKVRLPESWDWLSNWGATEFYDYAPYGMIRVSSVYDPVPTSFQYTGKPRESWELDYFGARYYMFNFAFRWISADAVTGRIYDPPSLNKYTYCRADPVNYVDPDGRQFGVWCAIMGAEGGCNLWLLYWSLSGGWNPDEYDPYPSTGSGAGADPQRIDPQVGTPETVRQGLEDAGERQDCAKFLGLLIAQLKNDGLVASDFDTGKLISNVADLSTITVDLVGRGRRGHVVPGTDHIQLSVAALQPRPRSRTSPSYFTADLWSTLLHEGFHLKSSHATGGFVTDAQLATALVEIRRFPGSRRVYGGDSPGIKDAFAKYCGPNAVALTQ